MQKSVSFIPCIVAIIPVTEQLWTLPSSSRCHGNSLFLWIPMQKDSNVPHTLQQYWEPIKVDNKHIHVYVCMCICIYVHTYVCMCMYTHMYVCVHKCGCMYICMCIGTYICVQVCTICPFTFIVTSPVSSAFLLNILSMFFFPYSV